MIPFNQLDPDLAEREQRSWVVPPADPSGLPADTYTLVEFYCDEPRCDCRRAILHIYSRRTRDVVASINHAFDPPDPQDPYAEPEQTFLDPLNPQSSLSYPLLALFHEMNREDPALLERLEHHYHLMRAAVDDPKHPHHARVRNAQHDDPDHTPTFPKRKAGRNDPCPCGSGKKYKKCCGRPA